MFHLTVNFDGCVFQNIFLSSQLVGQVLSDLATDACSVNKNQIIKSHFVET